MVQEKLTKYSTNNTHAHAETVHSLIIGNAVIILKGERSEPLCLYRKLNTAIMTDPDIAADSSAQTKTALHKVCNSMLKFIFLNDLIFSILNQKNLFQNYLKSFRIT